MSRQPDEILTDLRLLQAYLRSAVAVDNSDKDGIVHVTVMNDAPELDDGMCIVFTGVGLRIIDTRFADPNGGAPSSSPRVNRLQTPHGMDIRRRYEVGWWSETNNYGGRGFPAMTSDEGQQGIVLFPGQSVSYDVTVGKVELPFLEIHIEGNLSRRHLFHVSRIANELDDYRRPFVINAFRSVNGIDVISPFVALANQIPPVGPTTTFSDIDAIKNLSVQFRRQLTTVVEGLRGSHSAPGRDVQEYVQVLFTYIKSVGIALEGVERVVSSGDMQKIKQTTEELKAKVLTFEELKSRRTEIMAKFGISS